MGSNKAEIAGLNVENREDIDLEAVFEETKQARLDAQEIEFALSQEAVKIATGTFSDDVIYNKPVRTSNEKLGKLDWGQACNKIGCQYKGKDVHVHILGIGITGAYRLATAYGDIDIEALSPPEIKDLMFIEGGQPVLRSVWQSMVKVTNRKTNSSLELPYQVPVMSQNKSGWDKKNNKPIYSYEFNDYGFQICYSKNVRNAILAVIPENVRQKWIEEYLEEPKVDPKTEKKATPKAEKPAEEKPKEQAPPPQEEKTPVEPQGEMTVDGAIAHIQTIESRKHLENWYRKYSAWISKQGTKDKANVLLAYNQKNESFDIPQDNTGEDTGNDDGFNPATVAQSNAIKNLAKAKGITDEALAKLCLDTVGVDDVADMSLEQASEVITKLQE